VTIGTRRSRLARVQTEYVRTRLLSAWPNLDVRVKGIVTEGDRIQGPLRGGKGLFTSALEDAIRAGSIDMAVHSLKDLPVATPEGIELGAVIGRATARDVLLTRGAWTIDTLPKEATVGTSSLRRSAQIKAYRPDLIIRPIRGNVDTRIEKMSRGEVDALVLAQAGLIRLGVLHDAEMLLPLKVMLPAPGQGALAVQCRSELVSLLEVVECPDARSTTTAERTFLSTLGGGCATPVAAYACVEENGSVNMRGLVASTDGRHVIRVEGTGEKAEQLGARLAREALRQGAAEVLCGT